VSDANVTAAAPVPRQRPGLLGNKVAHSNMLMAGAALAVAGVLLVLFQYIALRSALLEDMQVQARMAGNNSTAALLFRDRSAAREMLAGLALSPAVDSAAILENDGQPLAVYRRGAHTPPPLDAELLDRRHRFHADALDIAEPVSANGAQAGVVVMRVSLAPLYRRVTIFAAFTIAAALASLALGWLLVARMRTAVHKAEQHLHYLAHVDPVTSLPNRNEFNEQLAQSLKRADRLGTAVALLLLDLDNFKVVNDTLGHNSGDLLLRLVGQRLRQLLRSHDVICRIGGDEFVVIIEAKQATAEADRVARKILAALAEPFQIEHHALYVTASIGMASYPVHGDTPQSLVRGADTAMYHAKNLGKNAYQMFQPEMALKAHRRLKIEANLRRALQQGELALHYQPQIDVRSGRMTGMEVLARWTCPELGPVSPAEFIPVAEESGVIEPLGRWVLESACRQAAAWYHAGLFADIAHFAVNLSAAQTRDKELMNRLMALLAETGLPASILELEITEGVMMENVSANLELLQRIQSAGIHLSIDDFGTGYSSMAYLQRFPIDQLKIDRSFVNEVPGDGAGIATAIIAMAHSLDLSVVAEGVETAEQVEFLRQAGCDIMQGYHFAKPMPAAQLELLLRERRQFIS
jgi:diguanylate cyclase (GGDEF)-like protein